VCACTCTCVHVYCMHMLHACVQALSRPYVRTDNRAVLSSLNDSLLREFLKLLPVLYKSQLKPSTPATSDMSVTSIDKCSVSQMLNSFSYELYYVLSRHSDQAAVMADKQCCKLLAWLPCIADICSSLLHSDNVSYLIVSFANNTFGLKKDPVCLYTYLNEF